ncbi:MAG: acyl carrier protein [Myxococcales bacterium]|nr:acyl carrier protein [Myxococcales bacterium]
MRQIMHELFDVEPAKVQLDAKLIDDLGLDSIDALDLVARLEQLTHEHLSEETLRSLRTVDDVLTVIQGMLDKIPEAPEMPQPPEKEPERAR